MDKMDVIANEDTLSDPSIQLGTKRRAADQTTDQPNKLQKTPESLENLIEAAAEDIRNINFRSALQKTNSIIRDIDQLSEENKALTYLLKLIAEVLGGSSSPNNIDISLAWQHKHSLAQPLKEFLYYYCAELVFENRCNNVSGFDACNLYLKYLLEGGTLLDPNQRAMAFLRIADMPDILLRLENVKIALLLHQKNKLMLIS